MKKRIGIFLSAAMVAIGAWAETWTDPDTGYTWTYQIYGDRATIRNGYSCAVDPIPSGAIVVPATLGGCPVTSIGDYAFYCCNYLTEVALPDNLTEIGCYAFAWCNSLSRIDIPDGVTSIEYNAFYCCYDLATVAIPDSVSYIGREAFNNCNVALYDTDTVASLKLVDGWVVGFSGEAPSELDMEGVRGAADHALSGFAGVKNVTSLPQSVCSSRLYDMFPDSYQAITNVTIADGVTDIGDSAFYGCKGMISISMPESITNIGQHAFGYCTNLASVAIPSKVVTLAYTFEDCSSLKEAILGASVSDVGGWNSCRSSAFWGCTTLTKIDVVAENLNFKSAGGLLLTHDGKEVVYVPEGRDYVFIPESVEKIPYDAFYRCPKLARTPDTYGIESIDGWIVGCDADKLPKQLVLNGYRGVADDAFYDCGKLVSVVFGEGMTAIGNDSFSWCLNLNSISIPASVRKIDSEAFRCCFGLKNISVSKENQDYKFENNLLLSRNNSELAAVSRNATSAIIPEGVRYIPNGFFAGCMKLTNVTIPATVVDMFDEGTPFCSDDDDDHYWGCPALKSITVADGNPVYKSESGLLLANYDDEGLALVAVPQALTKVIVPEGVEWIGGSAFVGCDKLSSLNLPSSIASSVNDSVSELYFYSPNLTSISVADDNPWFSSANGLLLTKDGTRILCAPHGIAKATLPASVADLGEDGFTYCNKLTSIAVEPGNKWFSSISGMLVDSDGELVEVPRGLSGQTSIKIPAGVRRIGSWTFSDFEKLTSIDIPEGVEEIGSCAFFGCMSLLKVKLPSTLKVIGRSAFSGCPVKSISLPSDLEEIGRGAFTDLTMFDTVTVPGLRLVDGWVFGVSETFEMDYADPEAYLNDAINSSRIKGIAGGAFGNCNGFLRKLKLPTCVKRIPYWMFGDCRLRSVELPDGLISIGEDAFVNCNDLESVAIPASVKHVGDGAFTAAVLDEETVCGLGLVDGWVLRSYGTKAIVGGDEFFNGELTLLGEDGIRGIADKAFCDGNCHRSSQLSNVSNLVIGAGIVSIGEQAFAYNVDLTNVTIAASVEFIGKRAFYGCENLHTAYLPHTLYGKVPRDALPANTSVFYCADDGTVMPELAIAVESMHETDADGSLNLVLPVFSLSSPVVTVSKLPSGLKYDPKTMTISGKLTKQGSYTVTVSATNATVKNPVTVQFEIVVGFPTLTLKMAACDDVSATNNCKVTGGGKYPFGKKVTVKATPARGSVFVGWYAYPSGLTATSPVSGEELNTWCLSQAASYAYVTMGEDVTLTAMFATETEDVASLKVEVEDVTTAADGTVGTLGEDGKHALDLSTCVTSLSQPKLAVSGLPSGVKYDAKTMKITGKATKPGVYTVTVKATNTSVKKATDALTETFKITVPNFTCDALPKLRPETDAYGVVRCGVLFDSDRIDCTPADGWTVKAAGLPSGLKYDAKTGKITGVPTAKAGPYTVTFTASKQGMANQVATITLHVEPLPVWAQGTFDGAALNSEKVEGIVSLTVAANGKISGKVIDSDGTWSLSAASYSAVESPSSNVDDSVFRATVIGKNGKQAITNEIEVSSEALAGSPYSRGVAMGEGLSAWQNQWKVEPGKSLAKSFANQTLNIDVDGGTIALKFAATGAVTAAGKFVTGVDAKGNSVVYSASCSSALVPAADGNGYSLFLYFPPKAGKFAGFAAEIPLAWDGEEFSIRE